jgi:hypothetical protein
MLVIFDAILSLLPRCVNPPRPNNYVFWFTLPPYVLLVMLHHIIVESILVFISLYQRITFHTERRESKWRLGGGMNYGCVECECDE